MIVLQLTSDELETLIATTVKSVLEESKLSGSASAPLTNKLMKLKEAAQFLNISTHTLYRKVSNSEVPHMKKNNKLFFDPNELLEYIASGKRKTTKEVVKETLASILPKS